MINSLITLLIILQDSIMWFITIIPYKVYMVTLLSQTDRIWMRVLTWYRPDRWFRRHERKRLIINHCAHVVCTAACYTWGGSGYIINLMTRQYRYMVLHNQGDYLIMYPVLMSNHMFNYWISLISSVLAIMFTSS